MAEPLNIAVFASGSGSNFQAIVDEAVAGRLNVRIQLLVCDRPKARVVERAQQAGIETHVFRMKDYPSREAAEQDIVRALEEKQVELIVLAGYMRIISEVIVKPYYGKMINVHPSLLPSFPGVNGVQQAIDYGVKVTGVTVHYVDGGMDTGPIIAQRDVVIRQEDTEETLAERIHPIEHRLLPEVIRWIQQGRVRLVSRKVFID